MTFVRNTSPPTTSKEVHVLLYVVGGVRNTSPPTTSTLACLMYYRWSPIACPQTHPELEEGREGEVDKERERESVEEPKETDTASPAESKVAKLPPKTKKVTLMKGTDVRNFTYLPCMWCFWKGVCVQAQGGRKQKGAVRGSVASFCNKAAARLPHPAFKTYKWKNHSLNEWGCRDGMHHAKNR